MNALGSWLMRFRVTLLAAAVPLLMRLPLPLLARVLEPGRASARRSVADVSAQVERVLGRRNRLVRRSCLTRGVTRYFFLGRTGLPVVLCFGVGRPAGTLQGHCWVELEGEPYRETSDPRPVFTETFRIPAP